MIRISSIIIIIMLVLHVDLHAQPTFELSQNVYRVPYSAGTEIRVNRDHYTHTSPNTDVTGRYDIIGINNGSSCGTNYPIVAAAEGIIRRIVDNHNTKPPTCDPDCQDFNNYVWIEHANGEWTKYTHMKRNSTSVDAGLQVGDQVCAGRFLGYECEIGQANGPHLHFEVRKPLDPANINISVAGGFMARSEADHLIPVINSISKHYFEDSDEWTASGSSVCTNNIITLLNPFSIANKGIRIYMASNTISTSTGTIITYQNGADGLFHAGNSVTLSPGFTASAGSYFNARIGSCSTTNMPGACN